MSEKTSDDAIKQSLIADAANPDAWVFEADVPAGTSPRPAWYGRRSAVDLASREADALRRKELHDAIAALPEGQRHAIQLWLDGFQHAEIVHALRISVDAVRSRLRDAKRHLELTDADVSSGQATHAARGR